MRSPTLPPLRSGPDVGRTLVPRLLQLREEPSHAVVDKHVWNHARRRGGVGIFPAKVDEQGHDRTAPADTHLAVHPHVLLCVLRLLNEGCNFLRLRWGQRATAILIAVAELHEQHLAELL